MARHSDWLYRIPRWRMPHQRHRRHHWDLQDVILTAFGWIILIEIVGAIWLIELEIWTIVWLCYGLFLGCRYIYRSACSLLSEREPYVGATRRLQQPGATDDWDGPVRRRT